MAVRRSGRQRGGLLSLAPLALCVSLAALTASRAASVRAWLLGRTRVALAASSDSSSDAVVDVEGSSEADVVDLPTSRPAALLSSEGVQRLTSVLMKLKEAPGEKDGETGLTAVLRRGGDAVDEMGDAPVPDHFMDDMDECLKVMTSASLAPDLGDPDKGLDWRGLLREFSSLRLSRRLPEVADELVPWDSVYPESLAGKTGVEQTELRRAVQECTRSVDLKEIASWSEAELEEARSLIEGNPALKEVWALAMDNVMSTWEELTTTAAFAAGLFALAPFALAALLVASCFSGGGGTPETTAPLSAEDLGALPLYKLGGISTP